MRPGEKEKQVEVYCTKEDITNYSTIYELNFKDSLEKLFEYKNKFSEVTDIEGTTLSFTVTSSKGVIYSSSYRNSYELTYKLNEITEPKIDCELKFGYGERNIIAIDPEATSMKDIRAMKNIFMASGEVPRLEDLKDLPAFKSRLLNTTDLSAVFYDSPQTFKWLTGIDSVETIKSFGPEIYEISGFPSFALKIVKVVEGN